MYAVILLYTRPRPAGLAAILLAVRFSGRVCCQDFRRDSTIGPRIARVMARKSPRIRP